MDSLRNIPGDAILHRSVVTALPRPAGDDIDLRALLRSLWRGKATILLSACAAALIAVAVADRRPQLYRATAKVIFEPQPLAITSSGPVAAPPRHGDGLQNQIEILRSDALIAQVVARHRLAEDPALMPQPSTTPPAVLRGWFGQPSPARLDPLLQSLPGLAPPPASRDPETRRDMAIDRVLAGLVVRQIHESDVVEIAFRGGDPVLAATVANGVAEQLLANRSGSRQDRFRTATDWLETQTTALEREVVAAEAALTAAHKALAGGQTTTARQATALTNAVARGRDEIAALRGRHAALSAALVAGADLTTLNVLGDSPVLSGLRDREAALRARERELASTLDPSHPSRLRLTEELTAVTQTMASEARRILQALRLEVDAAETRQRQRVVELEALEAKAQAQTAQTAEIRMLEQEATARRAAYETRLARLRETEAQAELAAADARILSAARPPAAPVGNGGRRTLMLALMLGALTGAGLVLLRERLSDGFRSPVDLEARLGYPVLALTPSLRRRHRRDLVAQMLERPQSDLAEAIRNLRTSVLHAGSESPPKVVMFSSATPDEGKSTTAVLTALAAQQMGMSAVIVDCDLRRPAVSMLLNLQTWEPGLGAVLTGAAPAMEAIHAEPRSGLHVLSAGLMDARSAVSSADLLASDPFRNLLARLRKRYDLVVLDTPPTLAATDARVVAQQADAVVFAVRWNHAGCETVEDGLRELTSVRARIAGLTMTLVQDSRAVRRAYGAYPRRHRMRADALG